MKNSILLFFFSISCFISQAQIAEKITIEASYGVSVPLNFVSDVTNENFTSTSHFDGGIRYMFRPDIGVKGELAYDKFAGKKSDFGMKSMVLNAQVHYNLGKLMGLFYVTNGIMGLSIHSGFGLAINKSLNNNSTEHSGLYSFGLTPMFKLSNKIALSSDVSYKMALKQHIRFDGTFFPNATVTNHDVSLFSFTIGAIYYLGSTSEHSDWSR